MECAMEDSPEQSYGLWHEFWVHWIAIIYGKIVKKCRHQI